MQHIKSLEYQSGLKHYSKTQLASLIPNSNLKSKKIHFIGIGGIGMSALARYYLSNGSDISGSDKENSSLVSELISEGLTNIWTPHNKKNIENINPDYVIYSTAISSENEELTWSKENKKTLLHRSDLLEIATNEKKLIAISGTHGKTTTSAMITELLANNDFNPTAILGGILTSKNKNVIIGNSEYFIVEADESDKSFLKGNPYLGVITNIEKDHLENYGGDFEEIKKSFLEFAKKALVNNGLIVCFQDKVTKELITNNFDLNNEKLITYGISTNPNKYVFCGKHNEEKNIWDIHYKGTYQFSLKLKIPGQHNLLNALATIAIGYSLNISTQKIKTSLENYNGVKRRFQFIKTSKELTIVDDYAHHPTEIEATIKATKELNPQRLLIVIQPHQAQRLKDLWNDFKKVLSQEEDNIFITDVYIARGTPIEGISSKELVNEISKPNVKHIPGSINQISSTLEKHLKYGDFILIMGAGDITNLGPILANSYDRLAT